jgi:hypothetical protein
MEFVLHLLSVFGANLDEGMNCADCHVKAGTFALPQASSFSESVTNVLAKSGDEDEFVRCVNGLWPVGWKQNGGNVYTVFTHPNVIECNNDTEKVFLIVYHPNFSGD